MSTAAVTSTPSPIWPLSIGQIALTRVHVRALALAAAMVLAFGLRTTAFSTTCVVTFCLRLLATKGPLAVPGRAGVPDSLEAVMRRLVVNKDDLGLTVGVNDDIFNGHEHGILTSATLFANAPATLDAIRRLQRHPSLGIGVHLALVDGTPTLPPSLVPTLLDGDERFRSSWKPFIVACLCGRAAMSAVERGLTRRWNRS